MTPDPRPHLGPQRPVKGAKEKDRNTHDGEHIVRVSVGVPVSIGGDERYEDEEEVRQQEDDNDRQVRVPAGCPVLLLAVVQVDEAAGDEAVDPGAGVCVQVDNKVVRRSRGRSQQHNDGDNPVQEELHNNRVSNQLPQHQSQDKAKQRKKRKLTEAAGELNGLFDPQNRLNGNSPSFPSS